jgi:gliding motility-associated-like protein
MKKKYFLAIFFCCIYCFSYAHHLKGGWVYYQYVGPGSAANTSKYIITVKQYLNCQSTASQIDQTIALGIFDAGTDVNFQTINISLGKQVTEQLNVNALNPCINPKPDPNDVCYIIDTYTTTVSLPNNTAGYILAVQRCCRIDDIVNVGNDDINGVGLTYTTTIPGVVNGVVVRDDNSPVFAQSDTAVVCINSAFTFAFGATDIDKDSLSYSFCSGVNGGDLNDPKPSQPSTPPYNYITYNPGYGGGDPLGPGVSIDPHTGLISGIAPGTAGTYVVAVCASEFRNGILIGVTRKEIHINVADCSLNAAKLSPEYITCNGFDFTFSNQSTNENINSYLWDFGVPGITTDTSTQAAPVYTYKDTGTYVINLHVSNAEGCQDSAKSLLLVYPGFIPNFTDIGSCVLNAFNFTDSTTTKYGVVNNWHWNFGVSSTNADTSDVQDPVFTYPAAGTYTASLIVANSKGCLDTAYRQVVVYDKPVINVPFADTVICLNDSVHISASVNSNTATYNWLPNSDIINANSPNPTVFPRDTTEYVVTVNDKGCVNTDSILVNVIAKIEVSIKPDTTICKTDTIQLYAQTNGLHFLWSPSIGLNDTTIQNPLANPLTTTTYTVVSSIGNCFASDTKTITVVPYPVVNAFSDTTICYGNSAQINGITDGTNIIWSPSNSLADANTLHPVASPQTTTTYTLAVTGNLGCPKSSSDTVTVTVVPKVIAFAGDDTTIVANQPLQLNATGGDSYFWTPSTGMDNPDIANPVTTLSASYDSITYIVTATVPPNCTGTDSLKVVVFKTIPSIFVPSAFTPNDDGRNDILKPILVGMKQLNFFRVYNRWGNLLYSTSRIGQGWDGTQAGMKQGSGTYVYIAEAIDYLGKPVTAKGTVVLIR